MNASVRSPGHSRRPNLLHVANEERLLSVTAAAEQEKLNALLRELLAGALARNNFASRDS
jgi:hypothetical protein